MISDEALIRQCQKGEMNAYRNLIERHQERLIQIAWRFLYHEEDARDAVQSAFIKAWKSIHRFRFQSKFTSWILAILMNECRDMLRKKKRRKQVPLNDDIQNGQDTSQLELEDTLLLRQGLNSLTHRRKQVIILMDLEGMSSREVADLLGCAESTVRVTRMKARQELKKFFIHAMK